MTNGTLERMTMTAEPNAEAAAKAELELKYGQVWNTEELTKEFSVEGFAAPCVVVRKKESGERGSLFFQHDPRFYWGFAPVGS